MEDRATRSAAEPVPAAPVWSQGAAAQDARTDIQFVGSYLRKAARHAADAAQARGSAEARPHALRAVDDAAVAADYALLRLRAAATNAGCALACIWGNFRAVAGL